MDIAADLAELSELEYKVIRYCKDALSITDIQYIDYPTRRCKCININLLAKLFENNGIKTDNSKTGKYLNDRTSSAFHQCQRSVLGRNVTASDIDLIKVTNKNRYSFYELKRSIIPVDKWEPFADDFANFRLIRRFADLVNADFKIVYNQRTKTPFYDDISKLKLFSFDIDEDKAVYLRTVSLEEFLRRKTEWIN